MSENIEWVKYSGSNNVNLYQSLRLGEDYYYFKGEDYGK